MKYAILGSVALLGFMFAENSANAQVIINGGIGFRPGIGVSLGVGAPGYYAPYAAPAPAVVYPSGAYVQPAPVVAGPAVGVSVGLPPVVIGGPVYRGYYGGGYYHPYHGHYYHR